MKQCLVRCALACAAAAAVCQPQQSAALTHAYRFSTPPDSVFVRTTPTNAGAAFWPAQILDAEIGTEENLGVVFDNGINNTVFFDDNALLVSNSSRMSGLFGWGDARNNGPTDPSQFVFDFTNRVGGVPRTVSFDFALSINVTAVPVQIIDAAGHVETVNAPRLATFPHGMTVGAEGRAVLTPIGTVTNIAKVRLVLPVDVFGTIQMGIDNLTFDDGLGANFDGDANIDAGDLAEWLASFGIDAGGDANGDGVTDGADVLLWQQQLGDSLATPAVRAAPEPGGAAVAASGILGARVRRRHASRCA